MQELTNSWSSRNGGILAEFVLQVLSLCASSACADDDAGLFCARRDKLREVELAGCHSSGSDGR